MSKDKSAAGHDDAAQGDSGQSDDTQTKHTADEKDPIKKLTKIVLALCLFLFIWHLFADRYTPFSDNARVRSYVVPIAPQVAGKLVSVQANFSKKVEANELLAQIDARSYQMALDTAEANLELAGQDISASTESISSAEAKLAQQQAQLTYVQQQASRYQILAAKGVVSKSELDRSIAEVAKAEANVDAAQAEFDKAKEQLGVGGQDNPKIRSAIAALGQARLDLSYTEIRAPAAGYVTNVSLDVGQYASPGQPIMTLISSKETWIEAYMRENNLGHLRVGAPVDIALDSMPGKVFKGHVVSLTLGVDWANKSTSPGKLPVAPQQSGWLRESQSFPVIVQFDAGETKTMRLEGGQVELVVYTGSNVILNSLAWLKIRVSSWLSYIY
ncbi:HlyD family secretion protein [Agaribacterium haliotis]|uniref:HlyD family secretion protein n=1 Tax=Agaribacterium haliotis TaxID=2013869 RepID=UPI001177398B|nr:HlyD family secretion protein [Agaribacterium haliotis]